MKEPTYDVAWSWLDLPPGADTREVHECRGLSPRTIVARIIQANRNAGPVIVRRITPTTEGEG